MTVPPRPRETKRATLKEVAQVAGVSVGMASRVLGGYGSFSDTTRTNVLAAARKLNYRPNAVARSLRVGRTKALGVVVANLASYHWITFVRGVETAAASHGYQVILGHTADDPAAERKHLGALYQRNVDGIIIAPTREGERQVKDLIDAGFPVVLTECTMEDVKAPRINLADREAAYEATRYLLGLGHRRIGLLAGAQDLASGVDRKQGYVDALRDAGVPVLESLIGYGEFRFEPGYVATERLMAQVEPPTALLVCNETMMGGALQCLKDRKVRIPDDISVVSFDDPPWATFFSPSVTTIRTPRDRMGAMAVEALLAMVSGEDLGENLYAERRIQPELVVRESCRSIAAT